MPQSAYQHSRTHSHTHTRIYIESFTRTVCLLFQWEIAGHFITKRVIGSNLFAPSKLGRGKERKKPFCALASTWARDACVIWLIHVHIVRYLAYQLDCTVNIKIDKIMSTDLYGKHFNVVITARLYFNNCHSTSLPPLFLSSLPPSSLFLSRPSLFLYFHLFPLPSYITSYASFSLLFFFAYFLALIVCWTETLLKGS